MEAQELKDKITQVVGLLDELTDELKGGTTIGVITQQVHTELVQNKRAMTVVLNTVIEAQKASEDQETKDGLPQNAASPASDAEQSET